MEQQKKAGVEVYRLRGFEFLLPETYTEKKIIITMEYLHNKTEQRQIKGRLFANYYGGYKPVFLNEFVIEQEDMDSSNEKIEERLYQYIVEGADEEFVKKINLFINEISEPESKSEFECHRYDITKQKQGKMYGLFFYLPKFISKNKLEISILYKKNQEGCLDVITYLHDPIIPYRVKLFAGSTKVDFYDPNRDTLLFDSFQCDKEIQGVLSSWDILREHMK